ncbi:serine/threonine-protein phosphatase [Blastococcus sp. TF02A-30]|nr:serine/threonine-protein phosphatase [Blastococcus sp. TF02A-30]
MPIAVLAVVSVLDVVLGRGQVVLGLVVIAPLVASTFLGRRATVGYGVAALLVAATLGVFDRQYSEEALPAQLIRLAGVAVGTGIAVTAATLRLRREDEFARSNAEAAESRAAAEVAETLQRHLLGGPPRIGGLEAVVRYLPATRHAQVGGDWYDGFDRVDGSTMLVIGDVAGHDAAAAATMAEARGMLRAIAQSAATPSAVLTELDRAMAGVGVPTLITAVVATVETRGDVICLRWSDAGHPAPVLLRADGGTEVLVRAPERLLGVDPSTARRDHEVELRPGDTVLLYTDGLVERRGAVLDEGTAWLVGELRRWAGRPLEELCDGLLGTLGGRVEDDVALLAVQVPGARVPGRQPSAVR